MTAPARPSRGSPPCSFYDQLDGGIAELRGPHSTKFRGRVLAESDLARLSPWSPPVRRDAREIRTALRTAAGLTTIWRALNQLDLTFKKGYTATNSDGPTSPLSDGAGATGCRCTTSASTCSSMSAA
jgi:hypothetical protein